jgi:sulfate adenylyltransferase
MPVTLDVSREDVDRLSLEKDKRVTLRDPRDDQAIAILTSFAFQSLILIHHLTRP